MRIEGLSAAVSPSRIVSLSQLGAQTASSTILVFIYRNAEYFHMFPWADISGKPSETFLVY